MFGAAERHLLKHRERIKTYSELRYSGCFRHGHVDHPVELLREICLDEHTAFYPRILDIVCGEFSEDYHDFDDFADDGFMSDEEAILRDRDREIEQKFFDEFESAIGEKLSKALCYNDKNANIWQERLEGDARSVALCLLLLLLPNLEELHITNFDCEGVNLESMLDLIAEGNHDPDPLSGPVALTKLFKVSVRGPRNDYSWYHALVPLVALPSLRTLTAKSVFSNSAGCIHSGNFDWPYEQHVSGLTVLDVQSSYFSAADFSRILGGIKGLKSFTYDSHYMSADDFGGVPMRSIISALLEHAKHSLESVTCTGLSGGFFKNDHGSGSFKDFEVLTQIRMHSSYYLKDVKAYEGYDKKEHKRYKNGGSLSDYEKIFSLWFDDVGRLVDLLPASVRSVKIDGVVDAADIDTLLKELPKRKAQSVPHLKSIHFTGYSTPYHEYGHSRALAHAWREECRRLALICYWEVLAICTTFLLRLAIHY